MAERVHPQHDTHHVVPAALVGQMLARFRLAIVGAYAAAVESGRPAAEVAIILATPTEVRPFLAPGEYEQLLAADPTLDLVCAAVPRARVARVLAEACAPCAARFLREAARGTPLHLAVGANAITLAIFTGAMAGPARGGETVH
ncbi:MAG: hypothetical protein JWM10_2747 [Myxococcaceae bacterium]|nr:hypothetical protein [Myxococcaceae bacterium]